MMFPSITISTNQSPKNKSIDSYLLSPAAKRRATIAERDRQLHEDRINAQQSTNKQQAIERDFLFREHVIGTVNASKQRRIALEVKAKLRRPESACTKPDFPMIQTVPVQLAEWRCSGAKTRILESNELNPLSAARIAELEAIDRQKIKQELNEMRQRKHSAIVNSFKQQQMKNGNRMRINRSVKGLSIQINANSQFINTANNPSTLTRQQRTNQGGGGGHRSFTSSPISSMRRAMVKSTFASPSTMTRYRRDSDSLYARDESMNEFMSMNIDTPSANAQSVTSARFLLDVDNSCNATPQSKDQAKFPSIFIDQINDPVSPMKASINQPINVNPVLARIAAHQTMDEFDSRTQHVRYSPRSSARLYLSSTRARINDVQIIDRGKFID